MYFVHLELGGIKYCSADWKTGFPGDESADSLSGGPSR